ncbi:ribulose-5-phosphate 4-epimerase/fuculose-1-phosphate aldolase [Mesorhizobium jarvisii]
MVHPVDTGASEFRMLRSLSARIGADPLLVQGAGGNTSIKQSGVLWIKASGTWLKNARDDEIMVPVALAPLLDAVAHRSPAAEAAGQFTLADLNPRQLRPSIETTVHALLPQKIVVHVHCVETISIAVQANAEALLEGRLRGLDWAFVPYRRPGLPLAQAIAERLKPATNVLVLGNHGLVVAADTVAEAALLLQRVTGLLARAAAPGSAPRSRCAPEARLRQRLPAAGLDRRACCCDRPRQLPYRRLRQPLSGSCHLPRYRLGDRRPWRERGGGRRPQCSGADIHPLSRQGRADAPGRQCRRRSDGALPGRRRRARRWRCARKLSQPEGECRPAELGRREIPPATQPRRDDAVMTAFRSSVLLCVGEG